MKLVYSNKSKRCLGEFNGVDGDFVRYITLKDMMLEAHRSNVTIIAEKEQLDKFMGE